MLGTAEEDVRGRLPNRHAAARALRDVNAGKQGGHAWHSYIHTIGIFAEIVYMQAQNGVHDTPTWANTQYYCIIIYECIIYE
jgi:hypothetical protein